MQHTGPNFLRRISTQVLDAMVTSLKAEARDGHVDIATLERVAQAIKSNPQFDHFYDHAYESLAEAMDRQARIEQRRNALGRLMCHPLADLLNEGTLGREMLPNLFHFFQLSLGDQLAHYAETCSDVLQLVQAEKGEDFVWDDFYAHQDARVVQYKVLWTIVKTFRNFNARQDWFIKLMQYHPSTISLGSHMFINAPRPMGTDPAPVFGRQEFCILFRALFRPLTDMTPGDTALLRSAVDDYDGPRLRQFLDSLAACPVE